MYVCNFIMKKVRTYLHVYMHAPIKTLSKKGRITHWAPGRQEILPQGELVGPGFGEAAGPGP